MSTFKFEFRSGEFLVGCSPAGTLLVYDTDLIMIVSQAPGRGQPLWASDYVASPDGWKTELIRVARTAWLNAIDRKT